MSASSSNFLDEINQYLHNAGIVFEDRLSILLELVHNSYKMTPVELQKPLEDILHKVHVSKEELIQKVFMFYGNKYLKKELDQFYTPLTIGEFLCNLCIPNRKIVDPACGTGDLVIYYTGDVSLWDISDSVTELTRQNYNFQSKHAQILTIDSLQYSDEFETFDYAIVNPPFGTKTTIVDSDILKNYELGQGKKKQEIGILFVEQSLKCLKDDGILFIILPNGYFGNTTASYVELRKYILQYRIIGIIKLPSNTFKRSGTGVSTNILVVSKRKSREPYEIFIEEVFDIGYELNKKNTPYKYRKELDSNGKPVLHNDLSYTLEKLRTFIQKQGIPNFTSPKYVDESYQTFYTSLLDDKYILDISRYLNTYKGAITSISNKISIRSLLLEKYSCAFKKQKDIEYIYLDIKEINTPLYKGKKLRGDDLPARAKYLVKKNDILLSKLKGSITFTVIMEDIDNMVCTNGMCVLRPKDTNSLLILFANLFTPEFEIQHRALTTGSIMESITDEDVKNILITHDIQRERYERILESIRVLQTELPK
jgi:type I restriction-modification system DNA methylase subunit